MNSKIALLSFIAALFMAGCASEPAAPRIKYPVTYKVQVGNTRVTSDYGPQNLTTQATQQVAVEAGRPLYYQVVSPFDVTVHISEAVSARMKQQISEMQGTSFTGMLTPKTPTVEFSFVPSKPNSGGTLQFTLSDQPIPAP